MGYAPRMTESRPGLYHGWWIVGASFSILLVTVGTGLYGPPVFLVPLQDQFGWSRAVISGGTAVGALTVGLVAPLVGVFIDRYGARKVMTTGGLVMGGGFFLLGAIQSLWQLYALNVIAAIGLSSAAWLPNQTLVSNWFDRLRGRAMGITLAGIGFGGLSMPPLAGLLIGEFGWRTAYAVLGALVLLVVVTVTLALIRSRPEDMGLLPDGEPAVSEATRTNPGGAAPNGAEIAGLSLAESVRTGAFWMLSLGHVFWSFGSMSIIGHLPAFLADRGFEIGSAASYLAFAIGLSVVGRVGFGVLADRFTKKRIMCWALILHAFAVICLLEVDRFGALPSFVVLFGIGIGGGAVLIPLLIAECFGLRAFGKVLGVLTISATLGAAAGPVLTGRIFDVTGSYQLAFILHIASFTASAVAFYLLPKPRSAQAVAASR
jgi:MFS family permease